MFNRRRCYKADRDIVGKHVNRSSEDNTGVTVSNKTASFLAGLACPRKKTGVDERRNERGGHLGGVMAQSALAIRLPDDHLVLDKSI